MVIQGMMNQKTIAIGRLCFGKTGKTAIQDVQSLRGSCGTVTQTELEAFRHAQAMVGQQLEELSTKAQRTLGSSEAAIFETHEMLLQDVSFVEAIEGLIQEAGFTAMQAVEQAGDKYVKQLSAMEDSYLQERVADLQDVVTQLQNTLIQLTLSERGAADSKVSHCKPEETNSKVRYFILTEQMLPSEVLSLEVSKVAGLIWSQGSFTSHAALLAKGLQIPVMILDKLPEESFEGCMAILDGVQGELRISPTEEEMDRVRKQMEAQEKKRELNSRQKAEEGQSKGQNTGRNEVRIMANVNSLNDVAEAYLQGADGIGLLRSEMLFLLAGRELSEEEQFQIYRQALEAMKGREVVVRTLDLGGDKMPESMAGYMEHRELNPALGVRGIRLLLNHPDLLATQLRALYRAGIYGTLKIMYPMITSVSEVQSLRRIEQEVKETLLREQIPFAEMVPTGIMIETPAAALLAEELAREVDFFSIGTNDLNQYTVAVDRQNRTADAFADSDYRATLKLVEMTASAAKSAGIPVAVCGDMAADPRMVGKLTQLGIQAFSVPVSSLKDDRICAN